MQQLLGVVNTENLSKRCINRHLLSYKLQQNVTLSRLCELRSLVCWKSGYLTMSPFIIWLHYSRFMAPPRGGRRHKNTKLQKRNPNSGLPTWQAVQKQSSSQKAQKCKHKTTQSKVSTLILFAFINMSLCFSFWIKRGKMHSVYFSQCRTFVL